MKIIIISLLLIVLLVSAKSNTISKVPNYYYNNNDSFAYCTSNDSGKPGCKCGLNQIFVNGYCITLDEEHKCGNLEPGMTSVTTCGDFGSNVDYCSSYADNEVTLVQSSNCFYNDDLKYGVVAMFTKISFSNMPVSGINAEARAKIISGLVATFPFKVSDVTFGSVYLDKDMNVSDVPTTIVEVRILTQKKYIKTFVSAVDNNYENGPASAFTDYLHTFADTIFSPCVDASFYESIPFKRDVNCIGENNVIYELGDVEYKMCETDTEIDYSYGYQTRNCKAEFGGSWTQFNKYNCIQKNEYSKYQIVLIRLTFTNLPFSIINYNLTKVLNPIFIENASSDLRDIKIFDLRPSFIDDDVTKIDLLSSCVSVLMSMNKDCVDYENSTIDCSMKVKTSFITNDAIIKKQIAAIDPVKFKDVVIHLEIIDIYNT